MDLPGWLSGVAAALSLAFAAWSWWQANRSRSAKESAEDAAATAQRKLDAMEATAVELRRLADAAQGPPLLIEPIVGVLFALRNNTGGPLEIESFVNAGEILSFDLRPPLTLRAREAVEFSAMEAMGAPLPLQLIVAITGRPDHVNVPFPR